MVTGVFKVTTLVNGKPCPRIQVFCIKSCLLYPTVISEPHSRTPYILRKLFKMCEDY